MLSLIAAVARNRAIGMGNQLLWHLPEDMRHFRETTRGKTVIMGRNAAYTAPGAALAGSLDAALRAAQDGGSEDPEVFVIGGAELYRQALPLADRLYLTEVAQTCPGDAFFPELPPDEWTEVSRRPGQAVADDKQPAFDFVVYERR